MSVVVAIKTEEGFMLGADSQIIHSQVKENYNKKIMTLSEDSQLIGGGVGELSHIQVLEYIDELIPEIALYKDMVDTRLMYTYVYPVIKESLAAYNRLDEKGAINATYILAYKDKAWIICSDGAIIEIVDTYAIGSGAEVALGSLQNTEECDPEDRIRAAIAAVDQHTIYVDSQINILTTY